LFRQLRQLLVGFFLLQATKRSPGPEGRDWPATVIIAVKRRLGGATLTVAVLVIFFVLTLPALLLLVELTGLAALLTRLTRLVALLILYIQIVGHEISS
jgi:hypothetical protein